MGDDDTRIIITRSFADRRSGADNRSAAEQQYVGERRSGLDRRQATTSTAEDFARQALKAVGVEAKLDLLARAVIEMTTSLAGIERRIRAVQQNTTDNRF